MTLVDSNVLLDLATDDPMWASWSLAALQDASLQGELIIIDVVYAEISTRYGRIEDVDTFVTAAGLRHVAIPPSALFSSRQRHSQATGATADSAAACCPTSSSGRMPPFSTAHF